MAQQQVTIQFQAGNAAQVAAAIDRIGASATRANTALGGIQRAIGGLSRGSNLSQALGLANAQAQLRAINNQIGQIGNRMRGLRGGGGGAIGGGGGLGGILGIVGGAIGVQQLTEAADSIIAIQNRLRLFSRDTDNARVLFQENLRVANETRVALEDQIRTYTRLQAATREYTYTQRELLDITAGVNQAFAISGSVGAEASASIIQFTQAISSNRLGGDELRSISEQAPRLTQALVDGLNATQAFGAGVRVTIGDLRRLGTEGKLTADTVLRAFQSQLPVLQDEFDNTTEGIGQALTRLKNNALAAFAEFNERTGFLRGVTDAINGIAESIDDLLPILLGLAAAFGTGFLLTAITNATAALIAFATTPVGALITLAGILVGIATYFLTSQEGQRKFILGGIFLWTIFKETVIGTLQTIVQYMTGDVFGAFDTFNNRVIGAVDRAREAARGVWEEFQQEDRLARGNELASAAGDQLRGTTGGRDPLGQRLSTEPPRPPSPTAGRTTRERGKTLDEVLTRLRQEREALSATAAAREVEEETLRRVNQLRESYNRSLTGEAAAAIREEVALNQRIERYNDLIDQLDPVSAAQREFQLDTEALTAALDTGRITQEAYNAAVARLNFERRDALDPMGAFIRAQEEERMLASLTTREREIERVVMEELTRQGLDYAQVMDGPIANALRDQARLTQSVTESQQRQMEIYERMVRPARDYQQVILDINEATERFGLSADQNLRLRMEAAREVLEQNTDALSGMKLALIDIREQAMDSASVMRDAFTGVFNDLEDQFASLFDTGDFSLEGVVDNLQQQLGRFAFRNISDALFESTGLGGMLEGVLGGAAGPQTRDMAITATGTVNIGGTAIGSDGLRGLFGGEDGTDPTTEGPAAAIETVMTGATDRIESVFSGLPGIFGDFASGFGSVLSSFLGVFTSALSSAGGGGLGGLFSSAASGIGSFFSGMFGGGGGTKGFAAGGEFTVGGMGGTDSQMVAFRASPNETVTIRRPDQMGDGGGAPKNQVVNFNIQTPDAESFRRSENQLYARAARAMQRADQRNN